LDRVQYYFWYKFRMADEAGSLRERKKRATRQAISDVATQLFTERGFDNVTVAQIAAAANVAKMTVFNYFARKEDLFFDREDESRELAQAALAGRPPGESPLEALRRLAHELVEKEHPLVKFTDRTSRFWRTVERSPALQARAREMRDALVSDLAKLIAEAVGPSRPDAIAHLAAASVVTTWTVAYAQALRRQRQGGTGGAARSVLLDLIDRGFAGVRASMKGTPYA
jgi:AcrR family transcriptional regulator